MSENAQKLLTKTGGWAEALPLFAVLDQAQQSEPAPTENDNGVGAWLWLDPRRAGWKPGDDFEPYLSRAVALFQAKPTWGGQRPALLAIHPDQAGNGIEAAAAALGLRVVPDRYVCVHTFRLGVATETDIREVTA